MPRKCSEKQLAALAMGRAKRAAKVKKAHGKSLFDYKRALKDIRDKINYEDTCKKLDEVIKKYK